MPERKTLILDLDETLVHCNETLDVPHDHKIKILFANGDEVEVIFFQQDWH
jgi:predicted HAD superfamily phosphohydrolase YqeG